MSIPLGAVGKIVKGEEAGRYVQVMDDTATSGGFLILTAAEPDMKKNGFDNWVENPEMLQRFFEEAGWVVDWAL